MGLTMEIREIREEEYQLIVQWNKRKDADFLQQWAGPFAYAYPISVNQIANRIEEGNDIYVIEENEKVIGSFEYNINEAKKQAFLSRVIMDEEERGKGLGTQALLLLAEKVFNENAKINKIVLHVYCYNAGAIRCYEKAGFQITELNEENDQKWNSYTMTLHK